MQVDNSIFTTWSVTLAWGKLEGQSNVGARQPKPDVPLGYRRVLLAQPLHVLQSLGNAFRFGNVPARFEKKGAL
jgi:hypothetical protein